MVPIALCLVAKDRTSQQRLAPQSDQPLGVKIFRVKRPEAHVVVDLFSRRWNVARS